jgi:hypothetical protein
VEHCPKSAIGSYGAAGFIQSAVTNQPEKQFKKPPAILVIGPFYDEAEPFRPISAFPHVWFQELRCSVPRVPLMESQIMNHHGDNAGFIRAYADRSLHPFPSLVLLDLDKHFTGGWDFLDWRKASASFSSLHVVIFSEFAYEGAIETALVIWANTFIAKPLGLEGWKAAVRQIWDLGITVTPEGNQWSAEAA